MSPNNYENGNKISKDSQVLDKSSALPGNSPQPVTSAKKSSFVYEDVLQNVVAYVEIRSDLEDLSALFGEHLLYLGASVSKTFNKKVTHVLFKNGKESTFKKAKERNIPVVNVLWLDGCKKAKSHIPEEPFIIKEYTTYGKRKRLIINSKLKFDDLSKSFEESKKIVNQIKASRKREIFLAPETPVQPLPCDESFSSPNIIPETVISTTKTLKIVINDIGLSPVQPIKRKLFSEPSGIVYLGPQDTKLYDENLSNSSVKESTPYPIKKHLRKQKRKAISDVENLSNDYLRSPLRDKNVKKLKPVNFDKINGKKLKVDLNPHENEVASPKVISGLDNVLSIDIKPRRSSDDFQKIGLKPKKLRGVPTIVFTSFSASMVEVAYSIVKSLGGFHVTNHVGSTTTHVICGEPKRTLNVLYGLVQGCYLLSTEWLMKSLEAQKWVEESPFELTESYASAEVRNNEMKNIFKDCGTFFISPNTSPPADDLSNLIIMGGGAVTSCLRKCTIIVGGANDSSPLEKYSKIIQVDEKCILDCISGLKTFST